jgi:acetyltransferase-like isoleucine patch superfamily enzyme
MIRTAAAFALRQWKIKADPIGYARAIGVRVGERCRFIGVTASTFGSEPYLVSLGDHVTITSGVRFITHDGGVWVFRDEYPEIDVVAPIKVGNNVFIGINAIILPGVTIGNNCVIGANSVVTRDILPDSIAAGTPAKVVSNIEVYKQKSLARAVMIRDRTPSDKQRYLRELFDQDAV